METKSPSVISEFLKKYWIAVIGAFFFLMGLLYLLKVLFEEIQIPPWFKIAVGFAAGFSGLYAGFIVHKKSYRLAGETIAGFGLAVVYGSMAWAVIGDILHLPYPALLIITGGFSIAVAYFFAETRLRVLTSLGLAGGLYSGFLAQTPVNSIIPISIYLLTINATGIFLSFRLRDNQNWPELRIVPFGMTVLLLWAMHSLDNQELYKHAIWEAFAFAVIFFIMYYFVFFIRTVRNQESIFPADLYLNAINAIVFLISMTSLSSLGGWSSAPAMIGISIILFISGVVLLKTGTENRLPGNLHIIFAGIIFALSAFSLETYFTTPGIQYAVRSGIWGFMALALAIGGVVMRSHSFFTSAAIVFFINLLYWYGSAWSVEWFPILGIRFIPFLNPGALVWGLLAGTAFFMAFKIDGANTKKKLRSYGFSQRVLKAIFILLGHFILIGLLTVQTSNLWDAYTLNTSGFQVSWLHSIIWVGYSLALFFTASAVHEKFFSTSASIFLLLTCLKVVFSDLDGQSNLIRALFLLLLGGMMMGIAWLLQKRLRQNEDKNLADKN